MTNVAGDHVVVDLNARLTGTHPLGALKGYFHVKHGYCLASLITGLRLNISMDAFRETFEKELGLGRIVVAGWCHDRRNKSSVCAVYVAGENEENLKSLVERIKNADV